MNKIEKEILDLMQKHDNISPTFVMRKMKVNKRKAEEICATIWSRHAMDWFYMRSFGVDSDGFLRGDSLNKPRNVVEPR